MDAYLIPLKTAILVFFAFANLISIPFLFWEYHRKGALTFFKGLIIYSFVFYLMAAFFMTLLPLPSKEFVATLTGPYAQLVPFSFVFDIMRESNLNLLQPKTYLHALTEPVILQVLFNVVLTIPFGVYLRYYFKKDLKQVFFFSLAMSLFYEVTQITGVYGLYPRPYRLFDVDDLMLNTLGGLVGYFLTPMLVFMFPTRDAIDKKVSLHASQVPFFRRIFAYSIDFNIAYFIGKLIFIKATPNSYLFELTIAILLGLFYFMFHGETIGYKIMRLKLISTKKESLKLTQSLMRSVLFAISYNLVFRISMDVFNTLNDSLILEPGVFMFYIVIMLVAQFIFVAHVIYTGIFRKQALFYERISKTKIISTL